MELHARCTALLVLRSDEASLTLWRSSVLSDMHVRQDQDLHLVNNLPHKVAELQARACSLQCTPHKVYVVWQVQKRVCLACTLHTVAHPGDASGSCWRIIPWHAAQQP